MANEVKQEPSANLGKSLKRSNKPMMERRRRERINQSLEMLKKLVLESLKKDISQYSKLEKADILEMTVKHLRTVQRQQLALAAAADSSVVGKYRAGFSECAQEVTRYLGQVEGLNLETRQKLEHHLHNCMPRVPHLTDSNQSQLPINISANKHQQQQPQQLHVRIPTATPMTSLPGAVPQAVQQIPVLNAQGVPQFFGAIQMVPASSAGNVMTTDVALFLPTSQMPTMTSPLPNNHHHSSGRASLSPSSSNRSSPASTMSHDGCSSPCAPSPPSQHHTHHQGDYQNGQHRVIQASKSWPQMAHAQNHLPADVQFKEEKVWRPW